MADSITVTEVGINCTNNKKSQDIKIITVIILHLNRFSEKKKQKNWKKLQSK